MVVGVGPWVKQIWDMLDLPKTVSIKGRDGKMHDGLQMWTYWSLQEGTLGVDPDVQKTNDGGMPPVIHVDTDAPLYSDVDGSLITDKLWGIYYKPDFHFGGVQGGAMPYKVETPPDQVAVDPYGPDSPDFIVGDDFAHMWCSALAHCQKRFSGQIAQVQEGAVGRHRLLHAGQLPGLRPLLRERLRHRRQQPRLQDGRRRRAGRQGAGRRDQPAAGAVPLLALRRGPAAPGLEQPVPVELKRRGVATEQARGTEMAKHAGRRTMSTPPGRAKLVKEVRKKIDELGITYIYYQFISVTGRIVGKGIPADHWERTAEKGFQLVYGSTANLFTDRHGQYIGYGPEASELIGIPDPETFCQLPWDKRVARVFCVCFRNREEDEDAGRLPELRLPRQPQAPPRRVPPEARHAAAHGLRARDDVAEEGRGRQPGRRRLQALLLPHRPVREPAPGLRCG